MEGSPSGGSSGLAGWDDDHDCNPGIVYRDVRSSRGGGLGDLAIKYGYYRYETEIMILAVVLMIVLVQPQMAGDRLVRHFTRK